VVGASRAVVVGASAACFLVVEWQVCQSSRSTSTSDCTANFTRARRYMLGERPQHTLQTTALVYYALWIFRISVSKTGRSFLQAGHLSLCTPQHAIVGSSTPCLASRNHVRKPVRRSRRLNSELIAGAASRRTIPFLEVFRALILNVLDAVTEFATICSVNVAVPEISRGLPESDLSTDGHSERKLGPS